uniref:Uncharacterized protein n=1 Tax=Noccaea caerulescens TaxID=107243 RepID=A0A1J3GXI9_NOCCA
MRLVKELQASLTRNDKLEKENHELRQEVARLKAPESVKSSIKGQEVSNPNPKPTVKEQSPATNPPPPPPLPSKTTTLGKRSVRRAPEVVELYRALTRRESHTDNKINQNGVLSPELIRIESSNLAG